VSQPKIRFVKRADWKLWPLWARRLSTAMLILVLVGMILEITFFVLIKHFDISIAAFIVPAVAVWFISSLWMIFVTVMRKNLEQAVPEEPLPQKPLLTEPSALPERSVKTTLLVLGIVSAVGFALGFFSLLYSVFGAPSDAIEQIPFVDNLLFALMFSAPVLSGAALLAVILVFLILYRKR